jgi:hypothetical protein
VHRKLLSEGATFIIDNMPETRSIIESKKSAQDLCNDGEITEETDAIAPLPPLKSERRRPSLGIKGYYFNTNIVR